MKSKKVLKKIRKTIYKVLFFKNYHCLNLKSLKNKKKKLIIQLEDYMILMIHLLKKIRDAAFLNRIDLKQIKNHL